MISRSKTPIAGDLCLTRTAARPLIYVTWDNAKMYTA